MVCSTRDEDPDLAEITVPPEEVARIEATVAAAAVTGRLPKRMVGRFAICAVDDVAAAATTLDCRPLLVWLYIVRATRMQRGDGWVAVPTRVMEIEWGVSRWTKNRALKQLGEAGDIAVRRVAGCNPVVKLLPRNRA